MWGLAKDSFTKRGLGKSNHGKPVVILRQPSNPLIHSIRNGASVIVKLLLLCLKLFFQHTVNCTIHISKSVIRESLVAYH